MTDETTEQTTGSDNGQVGNESTATEQAKTEPKTFTEDDLNRIVKDRLDRERKKFADYNDLKAAKAKLDEMEKAKLSDEEKAQAKLKELEAKIAEKEAALAEKALRDIKRSKIEQAIADGKMKLPKGKTIESLVKRMVGTTEEEIDLDLIELLGFFPPDEPSKAIGGGSQQQPAKVPDLKEQISALESQASKELDPVKRDQLQTQILGLKMRAGGFVIA